MSSFCAVIPTAEPGVELIQRLAPLGVVPLPSDSDRRLLIEVASFRQDRLESLAQRVAVATGAPAFALMGQTGADVYLIAEFGPEGLVRRLVSGRDLKPVWVFAGAPRPWEAELHFGLSVDELVEDLSDGGWTDAELAAVRAAFAQREPARFTRVPSLCRRRFVRFAEWLGVDLGQPSARWKPPGLIARLLGKR